MPFSPAPAENMDLTPWDLGKGAWRSLYPFASHFSMAGGAQIHYVDEQPENGAAARTLLFVHGNPTWSFHWRELIVALRSKYRCVAPDHLGCGLSDKPSRFLRLDDHIDNLAKLIATLDLHDVTLIAQDWGGAIGLGAMLRTPERLGRIILFNTGAFPPRYIPWRIRACRIPLVGKVALQGANAFSRAALRMTLARKPQLDPAVVAGYLAPYDTWANRQAVYGFVKDIPNGPSDPTWQTLAKIESQLPSLADRPTQLIWGMRDWCFRPDCLARFEQAWPHAEVHRLADVGHWVVEDAADGVLPTLQQFLSATDSTARHLSQVHTPTTTSSYNS
jgi:cis-3-alkyl-4-acyloxetan-2-one decarboxylase